MKGTAMNISGIQKLTLLDYPGKVACTLFTAGCNFRCPFCHNAGLVLPDRLEEASISEDEVMSFLKKRAGMLDGVAITGGEPLLHTDMPEFLEKIKNLGYKIKLDTNGSNPKLLKEIVNAGLVDRVAMDIKNAPTEYDKTAGCSVDMEKIEESKDFLLTGTCDYEFRTTVVKGIHTKESIVAAAKWISGAKEYYLQQFKDSGNLIVPDEFEPFDENEMHELADAVRPFVPAVEVRGV